jgi:hypothetical protein
VGTGITENNKNKKKTVSFWFKTQNPNFTDKNRLIGRFDRLADRFLVGFRFKIQIPKSDECKTVNQLFPPVYRSVFLFYCFQNLNFLNCKQPVDEPEKPAGFQHFWNP